MPDGPSYRTATVSSGRRPWLGLIAATGLVAVAVLKPWGGEAPPVALASPAPSAAAATTFATAVPEPVPRTAAELAVTTCPGSVLWMVHSFQRRGPDLYEVWTVADPVPAASADPATMIYTPIFASQVMGFGYCAAGDHALRPDAADMVTIWRVDPGLAGPEMVPAFSIAPDLRVDFGALMGPGAETLGGRDQDAWAPGKYLIRVGNAVLGAEVFLHPAA